MKRITLLVLFGFISLLGYSQVAVVENFDSGLTLPAGWTGTGYFGAVVEVCDGFSQRDQLSETSLTGNLTSPNQGGQSNGTDLTIAFEYKIVDWSAAVDATPPGWGELLVQYSTNDGGVWTTIGTINDGNHVTSNVCAPMNFIVPGASIPNGGDFKFQFVGNWASGDYYIYIDNVTATQEVEGPPSCVNLLTPTNGATGVSINSDLEWSTATNVPLGYTLSVGTTSGGIDIVNNEDTGISTVYDLPTLEYSTTYYVTIVPYNTNGDAVDCTEYSFTTGADPNAPVDCSTGVPINTVYCYDNNETITWNFQSSDGGILNIFFNAGQMESCCDEVTIYDGADNTAPVLYDDNNGGDMTGVSVITTGDSVFIEIDSDGSVSCQANGYIPLDFDVSCVDMTAVPNCNSVMISPANGEIDVNENADITWSPASILVTGYNISVGTTPGGTDIADNVDVGAALTYDPGTLPFETVIYVTIVPYNDNGSAENCAEQSFTVKPDPYQIVDCSISEVVNTVFCYENNDTTQFFFESSDGSPLVVVFNSGTTENNFDELIVLDSDGVTNLNAATPYGAGGNLAGLVFTSTGSTITVGVTSDGSVISCTGDPWNFDVSCVDTSQLPNCNSVLTSPTNGAIGINENDDINWSPATIFVTGYNISIGTTSGGTDIADNVDVGNVLTYDPGVLPFETEIFVTIIPYNDNGSAEDCTEESFTTRPDPFQIVDCSIGEVITTTHCYDSNENEAVQAFYFTSSDGSPLFILFNEGQVENGWDELYIIDSDGTTDLNAATPYGNAGDLTGLTYTSSGDSLTVYVESDGIISCQSSGYTPWDFVVACVDTTALPNCDSVLTGPVDGEIDVHENDDNLNWSQATVLVTGYIVTMGTTPGGTDIADNVDVGDVLTYEPGTLPYDTTIYVTITPYNDNGNAEDCTEYSFTTRPDPFQIVECEAGPVNTTFCYEVGDNTLLELFYFESSSGFPLVIEFNAGQVENNWDDLVILDSDGVTDLNAATPWGNNGDLTGITYISSGTTLTVGVISDGFGSCATSGYTPWDFDVWCLTCVPHTVEFVINGDCDTDPDNPNFTVNVDVTDMGDASSVTITDDQGGDSQVITEPGTIVMGPYPANAEVIITAVNTDDANCEVDSEVLTFVCPPPPNECSIVYAGEDVTVGCDDTEAELTAVFHYFGQDTNQYIINGLENCPQPPTTGGTPTSLETDDLWSDVIDMEFDFCFFGGVYNQILIGSNGVLSFELENAATGNGWAFTETLPNATNATLAEANIFGVGHDIDPSVCGDINYVILGSAPYRQFVVNYSSVCHFSCNELTSSSQIILYESSNNIDINVFEKPTCTTWNSGSAVIGVQNIAGTEAFTPPGRNTGNWAITEPESWRFAPGGDESFTFEWLDEENNVVGTEQTVIVNPEETTTYTAAVTYTLCTGGTSTVVNTVDVIVEGSEGDASFTMTATCDGGTADITGDEGGTFAFNPEPGDGAVIDPSTGTVTGGTSGATYTVEYTTTGDCAASSTQDVTVLDAEDASFTMTATCDGGTAEVSGTQGGMFSFNPEPGDGAVIDPSTGTVTGGASGATYTVQYTTSDSECAASSTQDVTVLDAEDASFTMTATCDGGTAEVTGNQGGTFAFNPEPGDGAVIDPSTGTVTGGISGATYTVEYTTSDSECAATSTQDVTVLDAEDASFTMTATCDGGTAEVSGTQGGTFAFNPEPGDGAVIDTTSGTVTGGTSGATYTVEYTTGGDCSESSTQDVTVLDAEDASFTMETTCDGGIASITGDEGGTFAFNPEPGDGAVIDSSTGTVTGGSLGSSYTIVYTTSGPCPASSEQTITLEDSEAPVAACNGITVMLDETGNYTLSVDDIAMIGDGSSDNCGIAEMSVSMVDFTCDNIGEVEVTLTVTDLGGNTSTCTGTITVDGVIPSVEITASDISEFCPGQILTANGDDIVSYEWTTGEMSQSIEVYENGTYGVTVTSITNCTAYVEFVVDIDLGSQLGEYAIVASERVFLHGNNVVETGGVGVTDSDGYIRLHQNSSITEFGIASDFDLNQGSTVGMQIEESASIELPEFMYNTLSNNSSPSVTIGNGETQTLNGDVYDLVWVREGATVIFSQPNVYIDKIRTMQGANIEFEGCANVYVNDMFILAKYGTINSNGNDVMFYVDNDVHIEKGSNVRARIYSNGNQILAKGENSNSIDAEQTFMTGIFISRRVHGNKNVVWNADECNATPCSASDESGDDENREANLGVRSWPNPSNTQFNLRLITEDFSNNATIEVYDMSNKLVHTGEFGPEQKYDFGTELEGGVYIVKIKQAKKSATVRLIKY